MTMLHMEIEKPCYGLKDASRMWFSSISEYLLGIGMTKSVADSCLFYHLKNNRLQGLIMIHIDDILSCGSELFCEDIVDNLRNKYKFGKVMRTNFEYTGINVYQNEQKENFIHQTNFISKLELHKYRSQHPENILCRSENKQIRKNYWSTQLVGFTNSS